MKISISDVRAATAGEWDAVWGECLYSTFFHSREWAEIWRDYTDGAIQPRPQHVTFSDGVTALLPLSTQTSYRGLLKTCLSSPAWTYGGWIARDSLEKDHADLLADHLLDRCAGLLWRLNPYDVHSKALRLKGSRNEETDVLDLSQSEETLLGAMNKEQIPRKVRIAEKHSLSIRLLRPEEVVDYYKIYLDCQKRWDKSTNNYGLLMFELCLKSPHCDFWGVFDAERRLICAGPIFRSNSHAVSWLTLASSDALTMKPYEYYYFFLIRYYKEKGLRWFDFNPSGGHDGVRVFKKSFGATALPCPMVVKTPRLAVAAGKLMNAVRKFA